MIAVIKLKTFDIELSVNENGLDGYEKPKRAHTANTMNIPDRETIVDLQMVCSPVKFTLDLPGAVESFLECRVGYLPMCITTRWNLQSQIFSGTPQWPQNFEFGSTLLPHALHL